MTRADRWRKRKCVLDYRAYKDQLKLGAKRMRYKVKTPLAILFVMPMSKSWSKKRKNEMRGKEHTHKPDIDNLLKGFMDALLAEDSHVHDVRASKLWGNEGRIIVFNNLDSHNFYLNDPHHLKELL